MRTLALVLVLVLLVGCLVAAATTVRTVSRIWLRHWVEQKLSGSAAADLYLEHPQRWLFAAGAGISALVFATGGAIGLRESMRGAVEQTVAAVVLLMLLGQLVPRAIARRWAAPLAPVLMPVLRALAWLCTPVLGFAGLFASHERPGPSGTGHDDREALEDLLREGELEGVGEASESAIISGVVEFGGKRARDVMARREDIVAVEHALGAAEVARIVSQSKYSRVPVYERDLDHVVGLVHSFDVLAHPDRPLASLRPVVAVRADAPCHGLMRRMLREHVHLAIIQGARGETVGVVTLEDLVEELVGDISDEHDEPQTVTP